MKVTMSARKLIPCPKQLSHHVSALWRPLFKIPIHAPTKLHHHRVATNTEINHNTSQVCHENLWAHETKDLKHYNDKTTDYINKVERSIATLDLIKFDDVQNSLRMLPWILAHTTHQTNMQRESCQTNASTSTTNANVALDHQCTSPHTLTTAEHNLMDKA